MSCPHWCEVTGEHVLHRAVVARLTGVVVAVDSVEVAGPPAAPVTVCLIAPIPEAPVPLVDFTPADARAASRVFIVGGRDAELGQALLRAADLAGTDHQQPPLPPPDHDGDRLTPTLAADIKTLLERHGYRLPTDPDARNRATVETLAVLGFLGKAFEGHAPQADPATTRWNEAIDWLLNSRWTADPDIQAAFWGVVDGRCTVEEADAGHLADGTPLTELPEEGADDE